MYTPIFTYVYRFSLYIQSLEMTIAYESLKSNQLLRLQLREEEKKTVRKTTKRSLQLYTNVLKYKQQSFHIELKNSETKNKQSKCTVDAECM